MYLPTSICVFTPARSQGQIFEANCHCMIQKCLALGYTRLQFIWLTKLEMGYLVKLSHNYSLFDNHLRKELMPNILNLMRGISVFFCMYFHLFLSFFVCDLVVPCVCVCSVSFFLCLWSVCAMCVCVMLLPLFACDLFVPCVCVFV